MDVFYSGAERHCAVVNTNKCSQADDQVASSFSSSCVFLRFANQLCAYCHLVYWAWNKITSAKADQRHTQAQTRYFTYVAVMSTETYAAILVDAAFILASCPSKHRVPGSL